MLEENLLEEDSQLPSGFHWAGGGGVKVCRKGELCPQARIVNIVNSLHCFC